MTGIERLRELVDGISPITALCGVTKSSYDRSHIETVGARLRDFLADIADQIEREQDKVAKTDWDTVRKVSADMADRVFMSATIDELLRDWSRKLNNATDGHVASDEREQDSHVSRVRVLAVTTDMERHVLGHEGMEDSPVARWARELREALGATSSRHESDTVADMNVSAYDLLPADEREAIALVREHGGLEDVRAQLDVWQDVFSWAVELGGVETCHEAARWVREHGGLEAVRNMAGIALDVYQRLVDGNAGPEMLKTDADTINAMMAEIDESIVKCGKERTTALALLDESVPRVTYERHILKRQRQIDESHAALRRRNEMLKRYEEANEELLERAVAMKRRLMPEGCEWPRYESGEPVRIGDAIVDELGHAHEVSSVEVFDDAEALHWSPSEPEDFVWLVHGERVKRPAPKVLDADGVEIREKRDVWWICEGDERGVHAERLRVETIGPDGLVECSPYNGGTWVYLEPSELYVNKPVPASDGRPLREGETVYEVDGTGHSYKVVGIRIGDGDPLTPTVVTCDVGDGTSEHFLPSQLTHERPVVDTWERLEKDANDLVYDIGFHLGDYSPSDFNETGDSVQDRVRDLVRRAKELAGGA